jgi:hypothetical protein
MTVNEMVEYIAEDLGTPGADTKMRIAHALNLRYKQVTSAIGMSPTRREELNATAVIGDRFMTFTGAEKLDVVFRKIGTKNIVITEVTDDEMLKLPVRTEPPTNFSIFSTAPANVTIQLDCTPTTQFILYAHVLGDATTLTGNDQPAFPESYHDLLIHGVKADEYRRREKMQLAKEAELAFQQRLSDLRMFLAKSAYLDIYRGKHATSEAWWDLGISQRR